MSCAKNHGFPPKIPGHDRRLQKAGRQLAIGYRCQFDHTVPRVHPARAQQVFSKLEDIEAGFGFTIGDPSQWRLNKALSGGGP